MSKQTAVEQLKQDIDLEIKSGTKMVVNWDMYLAMEKEQSYNLDDLRNAYRWGITATIGTSDHFEEFVNNIKSE